jgi:hypothetical protein
MLNRIFSDDSAKAIKAQSYGWLNAIHYLAPHDMSGVNLCPKATPACIKLCLGWYSGQASMVAHQNAYNSVRQSRVDKARRFMRDRKAYMADIVHAIELMITKAGRMHLKLCIRMNGSSDIAWEGIACERNGSSYRNLMLAFPELQFVDYTKIEHRLKRPLPTNYRLILSRSETNENAVIETVRAGNNAAAVFDVIPQTWNGLRVINGDQHDLRHLDPLGVVVGLTPKGSRAKHDRTGFVVRLNSNQ